MSSKIHHRSILACLSLSLAACMHQEFILSLNTENLHLESPLLLACALDIASRMHWQNHACGNTLCMHSFSCKTECTGRITAVVILCACIHSAARHDRTSWFFQARHFFSSHSKLPTVLFMLWVNLLYQTYSSLNLFLFFSLINALRPSNCCLCGCASWLLSSTCGISYCLLWLCCWLLIPTCGIIAVVSHWSQ